MSTTVFAELKFWLLIVFSIVLPACVYAAMMAKRAISRNTTLLLGLTFVAIAGVDVYLLRSVQESARISPSVADDAVFLSEISLALYLLPAMFGGVGINIVSHVIVAHLDDAEKRFRKEHPDG